MLKVIMYHFIHHEGDDPVFKGIPGLTESEFDKQLRYLCKDHEPISHHDLKKHIRNPEYRLPDKCFYITFDEGLKQQFINAIPILNKYQVSASFYIPTMPLRDRKISLVEKQRVCQYTCFSTYRSFLNSFMESLFSLYPQMESEQLYPTQENINAYKSYLKEFDFYSDEERFYRKVRNDYLSVEIFEAVINKLFLGSYGSESEFIDRYYMTWEEIKNIESLNMVIGGHSHSHPMLDKLPISKMKSEIDLSLSVLDEKLKNKVDTYAYPYGTYNKDVISYLKDTGIIYAFATGNCDNESPVNPYEIKRIDESSLNIDRL
jgi:peptidoglycan/xylan/chitin deacetylase (PgdA/CDA1 family)